MTSHMLLLTYNLHLIPSHFCTHVVGHHWHSFGKPLAKVLTWIFWGVFHCHLGGQVSSVLHQENLQKNGHCGGVVTEYLAHFPNLIPIPIFILLHISPIGYLFFSCVVSESSFYGFVWGLNWLGLGLITCLHLMGSSIHLVKYCQLIV